MKEGLHLVYHNIFCPNRMKDYADLKGLKFNLFRAQISFLCRNYEPVDQDLLIKASEDPRKLPSKYFYCTFDDGYKEHILLAKDMLREFGITGGFYINTMKLEEKKLITVDRQRFLQYAREGSFMEFLNGFCETIQEFYPEMYNEDFEPTSENIRNARDFYVEFPWYSDEERFYRKIRDVFLNERQVQVVVDKLFLKYFTNEEKIVEQYFLNWDDLRCMVDEKMEIGCHTHAHPFLPKLTYDEQFKDIRKNKEILEEHLGVSVKAITYPYGVFDHNTVRVCRETGIRLGFMETGEKDINELKDVYRLHRLGPECIKDMMENESGQEVGGPA